MGLVDAPAHVWGSIATAVIGIVFGMITIFGFMSGFEEAAFIWILFLGWEFECHCDSCEETTRSATEIVAQEYAKGNISDEEMEEKIESIEFEKGKA